VRVVVLEAGIDYVEQLESFDLDGVSGPQALDGALAAVAAKGYRIMHNSEGGCCEHCSVSEGTDYVAVTVYPGKKEVAKMYDEMESKGARLLIEAIRQGELGYFRATGSTAYVAEYEDGEMEIVFNALYAQEARPGVPFEIVAEARWDENRGLPGWHVAAGDEYRFIDTDEAGAEKELTELLHLLEQLSQEEKQQLICTAKKMLEEEKQGAN